MFRTIRNFFKSSKSSKDLTGSKSQSHVFVTTKDGEWDLVDCPKTKKLFVNRFWRMYFLVNEFISGEKCEKASALRAIRTLFHPDRFQNCDIDVMELSSLVNSLCDDYDGKISHEEFAHKMYGQLQTLLELVSEIEMETPPQHEDPPTNESFM